MRLISLILLFAVGSVSEIDFSSLMYDYSGIPDLVQYQARDHTMLDYRYYPSSSKNLMIILHGSGYHSRYLYKLAKTLSDSIVAQVVTPDLRGHGIRPTKRGDIVYIGQLDDDLDDFVQFCITTYRPEKIFIAGHSSGGGLALRLMGNAKRHQADGYVLLAPYLAHDAPTTNTESGWAKPSMMKVILAHMLNGFGLHWLDHAVTIEFNLPKEYRDSSETLLYTHALVTSFSPTDYQNDLQRTSKKALVVVGEDDEAMNASEYQKLLHTNTNFELIILPKINHMSVVTNDGAAGVVGRWLNKMGAK
jgi:non-heme chloroperoxidase